MKRKTPTTKQTYGRVQLVCTYMFCSWRFPVSMRHLFLAQKIQRLTYCDNGCHVSFHVLLLVASNFASSADCQKLTRRVLVDCHHVNGLRFPLITCSPLGGVLVHKVSFSLSFFFFFLQSARSAHVTGYWK
jgi:hypothetical protein